jgi:hypothetical protein
MFQRMKFYEFGGIALANLVSNGHTHQLIHELNVIRMRIACPISLAPEAAVWFGHSYIITFKSFNHNQNI